MLIALLALLGVDLIVIVALAAMIFGRRRWLRRQPGAFSGAIRVTSGDVDGLGPKWRHGSGRWVRDVLVWNKAPFMLGTHLLPVDRCSGERKASAGELRRLGETPIVLEFVCGDATIEVAGRAEHLDLMIGPLSTPSAPSRQPG
jgi:hypothetical protein